MMPFRRTCESTEPCTGGRLYFIYGSNAPQAGLPAQAGATAPTGGHIDHFDHMRPVTRIAKMLRKPGRSSNLCDRHRPVTIKGHVVDTTTVADPLEAVGSHRVHEGALEAFDVGHVRPREGVTCALYIKSSPFGRISCTIVKAPQRNPLQKTPTALLVSAGIFATNRPMEKAMFEITITTNDDKEYKGWVDARSLAKHMRDYAKNDAIKIIRIERARVAVLEVE